MNLIALTVSISGHDIFVFALGFAFGWLALFAIAVFSI